MERPNGAQYHYLITEQPQFSSNRFKILVVGSKQCGKTEFIRRLENTNFADAKNIHEGFSKQALQLTLPEGLNVRIELVDMNIEQLNETMENITSLRKNFISGGEITREYSDFLDASGVFVLYDITNIVSYNSLSSLIADLGQLIAPDCELMLIGCKSDMKQHRSITYEQAEKFSYKIGLSLLETSAKTGLNCTNALHEMVDKIYEKRGEAESCLCNPIEEAESVKKFHGFQFCQIWSCQ